MDEKPIEDLTKSKSIIKALCPIADQVINLKSKSGIICDADIVLNLLKQCTNLQETTKHLMNSLIKYSELHQDVDLLAATRTLQSKLTRITNDIEDSTRNLHRGGDITVEDNEDVWQSICNLSDQLLGIVVDALIGWDKSQLNNINKTIEKFKASLDATLAVESIHYLHQTFTDMVVIASKLFETILDRCKDISRSNQCETVYLLLSQIHSILPLFASTCAFLSHYPFSKHIKTTQTLVYDRICMLLNDLKTHVGSGVDEYDLEDPGCFIFSVDKVLLLLIGDENSSSKVEINLKVCEEIKPFIEKILQHCIAVAQCCLDYCKKEIVSYSEKVLIQYKALLKILRNPYGDSIDINIARDKLVDLIEILEQKTNTALIWLIIKTFSDPILPMKELMYHLDSKKKHEDEEKVEKELTLKMNQFDARIDDIFQVGGFAASCTTDVRRVQNIRNCLMTLEWLETCFVVAVRAIKKGSHEHAYLHAYLLSKHWETAVLGLKNSLDQILDAPSFCLITKQEVHRIWGLVKQDLCSQDLPLLNTRVKEIEMLAVRIMELHNKTDFLTENQLNEIKAALSEIKLKMKLVNSSSDESLRKSLLKRIQLLLTILNRISHSLNEENYSLLENCEVQVSPNIKPGLICSEDTRHLLLTSDIKTIPIDTNSPLSSSNLANKKSISTANLKKNLRRSSISLSKIGESRLKAHQADALSKESFNEENNTSIDITRFLTTCSSTRSSIRSSKKSYSLKIKEIYLDFADILQSDNINGENSSDKENKKNVTKEIILDNSVQEMNSSPIDENKSEVTESKSFDEVSNLIQQQETLFVEQPQNIAVELSGILDNITSLANTFTSMTEFQVDHKKDINESENKENCNDDENLFGIKLQNKSFEPYFPIIESTHVNDEESLKNSFSGKVNIDEVVNKTAWKNLSKTLDKSQSVLKESHTANLNLSDTPFSFREESIPNVNSINSYGSISPSSIEFGTPQRLYDLCIVRKRLASLKEGIINK